MNIKDLIPTLSIQLTPIQKQIFLRFADIFHDNLPDTLYQNQFELSDSHGGSAEDWEKFINTPEIKRFIETKVKAIAEIEARKSLLSLDAKTGAKLLSSGSSDNKQIIIMHMPIRGESHEPKDTAEAD